MKYFIGLLLCLIGTAHAAESNIYWRADLHQGTSIIAYGQGSSAEAALQDCYRLQANPRAMTATETRKGAVSAVSTNAVRWCNNPRRYSTVTPDPVAPPPAPSAALSWTPPTQNTNGTTLTNLAGYRINYGMTTALAQTIRVADPGATRYSVSNLPPGTYYFAVRAYTSNGAESAPSNMVQKVVQ